MAKQENNTAVETPPPASIPFAPVNQDLHEQQKKRMREQQDADRPRLLDCLDPTVAKSYEDRKPLYEWSVKVRLFRPAFGRQPARMEDIEKNVVAQNENDAWAMFCDVIGEWPSRRGVSPEIKRLKRRTLRDSSEQETEQ